MAKSMVKMKRLIIIFLLTSNICNAQTFANDTTLSGTYDAGGKVMNMQAEISGNVTITNAVLEGDLYKQVFDTTVSFGANVRCREFSAMWFGASPSKPDNSRYLQIAIDNCIKSGFDLFLPSGDYKYSQSLMVAVPVGNNTFGQSTLNFYGESTFWSDKSKLDYSGDSCAVGFQLNKGSRFHNLTVIGGWISPTGSDSSYFNTSFDNYTNQAAHGNGVGIWIDPVGNWNQKSGSTGCQFYDLNVTGFKTLIQIGNGITQNDEILRFTNIQLGNGKVGIQPTQLQEKVNVFDGIYSWGAIHTIFNEPVEMQAGNYYGYNWNIAGRCIRPFNVNAGGFFSSHFSNIYAENIGYVGNFSVNTYYAELLPISISNSSFDFALKSVIGSQPLIKSNSNSIRFSNCSFRYYGADGNSMDISGGSFDNCYINGTPSGGGNIFIGYVNGNMIVTPSAVYQTPKIDTIPQPPFIKLILRSSNP